MEIGLKEGRKKIFEGKIWHKSEKFKAKINFIVKKKFKNKIKARKVQKINHFN